MKQFILVVSLFLSMICFYGCKSKTVVKRLEKDANINGKNTAKRFEGVVYRLPRTVITATVPMKKKTESPGKFSNFTPCFFDADEAFERVTEKTSKILLETPTFKTTGEPDPNQTFVVKTKGGYFENKTLLMEFSPTGILVSASAESKDETLDFALAAIKTVVGIGAKVAPVTGGAGLASSGIGFDGHQPQDPELKTFIQCYLNGIIYRKGLFEKQKKQLEKDKSSASPQEKTEIEKKISELTKKIDALDKELDKAVAEIIEVIKVEESDGAKFREELLFDSYKRAKKASERLDFLQKIRNKLTENLENLDAEIYKLRLKELDEEITSIHADFFGEKEEKNWTGEFAFRPQEQKNFLTIFVYSKTNGICTNESFGKNLVDNKVIVPKEFRFENCQEKDKDLTRVQLLAEKNTDDKDFITRVNIAKNETEKSGEMSGWYYRIPARSVVSLNECAGTEDFPCVPQTATTYKIDQWGIAQFGAVVSIPASMAGRSSSSSIVLDEATGALKNFKVSSSPTLDKSMLETVESTVNTAIDAADPLTKKKRELELLETQNKINEERKKLSNSNTSTGNDKDNNP